MGPAWDNLDAFLDTDEFAIVAALQPQGGASRPLTGIFDEPFMDTDLGEYDMDQVAPRFVCRADQVGDVRRGDTLTIGAQVYDIMQSPMADGTGMATLRLAARRTGT